MRHMSCNCLFSGLGIKLLLSGVMDLLVPCPPQRTGFTVAVTVTAKAVENRFLLPPASAAVW